MTADSVSGCDPRVRSFLVCPLCRAELEDRPGGLVCVACARRFPVVDGVPWMTLEDSERLPSDRRATRPVDPDRGGR